MKTTFKSSVILLFTVFAFINLNSVTNAQTNQESNKVKLNQNNFNEGIKDGYVLVDFWASWCRPCLIQKPILEEVAGELKGKITVATVNTERNAQLTQRFNIRGIPCMILFKDGKEVKRLVGLHQKDRLMSELSDYIK